MPEMQFCVDELHQNVSAWEGKISAEQERKRQDSAETVFTDGMLSPRTLSTVNPFDTHAQKTSGSNSSTLSPDTDLRKALFAKSPFGPKSKRSSHEDGDSIRLHLPRVTSGPLHSEPEESHHPSPSESIGDPESRRSSSKPQVQTSYATGSIPGLSGSDPSLPTNEGTPPSDVDVTPSLVTDPVLVSPPINDPKPPAVLSSPPVPHENQESSHDDTKESTTSAAESHSQATSATTGQAPLSPSTKGTSLASRDSDDRATPKGNGQSLVGSPSNSNASNPDLGYDGAGSGDGKGVGVGKTLRKKSSRFRMNSLNFWKRNKSASPPVPSAPFNAGMGTNRHQSLDNSRS
jgi:3',5'-cyclic-nucleotide phosphodiesterase